MADVLCLEPDGKAVLELNGKPCLDVPAEKATGQLCVDLALDDGHATDESAPAKNMQPLMFPALLPVLSTPNPSATSRRRSSPETWVVLIRATA